MRFSYAALLAFASAVLAADPTPGFDVVTKPTKGDEVTAGSTYEIQWETSDKFGGTVTIDLLGGDSDKLLNPVDTIAKGVDNTKGSYSWAVASTLGKKATYGLMLTWEQDKTVFQWSFPFKIVGGSASASSTSGSTTASPSTNGTVSSTLVSSTPVSTPPSNLSTTRGPSQTTLLITSTTAGPTRTGSSSSSTSTNAAAAHGGSSLALFGGIAMAVFAL